MKNIAGIMLLSLFAFACTQKGPQAGMEGAEKEEASTVKPIPLTKDRFLAEIMDYNANPQEWKYKGELPALIDFYAEWCAPCRITSPIIDELAGEYKGRVAFYKIDTDEERELAQVFGIQGIPSFLYIPMEGKPSLTSGIAQTPEETKEMFREMIDELLLNSETQN